jgi:hypothetical protein
MRPKGVATAYYVIDRIEGTVLRIDTTDRAFPDWTCAVIDEAERVRRLEQAREILKRLEDRDPGGDVTL